MTLFPEDPTLVAASVWDAANVHVPLAESGVVSVSVQLPVGHVVEAGVVALPPSVTLTGPSVLEHAPPTEVTVPFVLCGKVTVDPFTLVSVTVGAVLSIVTDLLPEPPALPAASVCEATKAYVPSAE